MGGENKAGLWQTPAQAGGGQFRGEGRELAWSPLAERSCSGLQDPVSLRSHQRGPHDTQRTPCLCGGTMGRQSQAQAPLVSIFAAREASGDPEQKPDSWGTAGAAAGWGRVASTTPTNSTAYLRRREVYNRSHRGAVSFLQAGAVCTHPCLSGRAPLRMGSPHLPPTRPKSGLALRKLSPMFLSCPLVAFCHIATHGI